MKRGAQELSAQVKAQIYGSKGEGSAGQSAEAEIAKRAHLHEQVRKEKKKGSKKEEKPGRSWSRSPSRDILKSCIEGKPPGCFSTL